MMPQYPAYGGMLVSKNKDPALEAPSTMLGPGSTDGWGWYRDLGSLPGQQLDMALCIAGSAKQAHPWERVSSLWGRLTCRQATL